MWRFISCRGLFSLFFLPCPTNALKNVFIGREIMHMYVFTLPVGPINHCRALCGQPAFKSNASCCKNQGFRMFGFCCCSAALICKHIKDFKKRYFSGQDTTREISGLSSSSCFKTTLEQQLNGEQCFWLSYVVFVSSAWRNVPRWVFRGLTRKFSCCVLC